MKRALSQEGGSVVEFAIVAPVFVAMVMFATYFADAVQMKLANQEAARFAAWEFTAFPLSDYTSSLGSRSGQNTQLYNLAQGKIDKDLKTIYSDFDSSQSAAPGSSFVATHTLEDKKTVYVNDDVKLDSPETLQSLPGVGGAVSSLLGSINGGLDLVGPQAFGFNMKGMIGVTVYSQFKNQLLPKTFLTKFEYGDIDQWEMYDKVELITDGWTLHDGRDSVVTDQTVPTHINGSGPVHPMATQVDEMVFLGLKDKLMPSSVRQAITSIKDVIGMTGIDLADPLFLSGTPVNSINYRRAAGGSYVCSGSSSPAKSGEVDMSKTGMPPDKGQKCFQTIPFRVTWSYNSSPEVQLFNDSNRYYLGCKATQVEDTSSSACH